MLQIVYAENTTTSVGPSMTVSGVEAAVIRQRGERIFYLLHKEFYRRFGNMTAEEWFSVFYEKYGDDFNWTMIPFSKHSFVEELKKELLPWSKDLPESCFKPKVK